MKLHQGYIKTRKFFTSQNASEYDSIVSFCTFGQDSLWKKQILRIIDKHDRILDLACGTGILSSMLINTSAGHVMGLDLSFDYLQIAKSKMKNFLVVNSTAERIPYKDESFDSIMSSYLAKYVNIKMVVDECWRILRPNGIIVFHDFIYPKNSIMQRLWDRYLRILKTIGYFLAKWATVFQELSQVIKNSKWVEETIDALKKRGFKDITCKHYTFSTAAIVSAKKNE
jgi:demethylmenaquinone methyltransferase/2-methoxy-6-polyprenyl-1,4-benzoquinol methylase